MARRTRRTRAHRHTIAVRRICRCKPSCHQPFTAATRKKHYAKLLTKAQRAAKEDSLTYSSEGRSDEVLELEDAAASVSEPPEFDFQPEDYGGGGADDNDDAPSPFDILAAALSGHDSPRRATSGSEDGEDEQPDDADYDVFDEIADTDEPVSREDIVKLLEEMFGPVEDGSTFDFRNDILTEKDRDNIRMFYCKLRGCIPRDTFQMIRFAVGHKLDIDSEWVIAHRLALLVHLYAVWYDCCIRGCMAYTGDDKDRDSCRYCPERRFNAIGKARRQFAYLPLIPRLRGLYMSVRSIRRLAHRANSVHIPGVNRDYTDGAVYRDLLTKRVTIDGVELDHRYFSDPRDIALAVCSDGFLLFNRKRKGPSATPMIMQNLNICPEERIHLQDILFNFLCPGPKAPKDERSFALPLEDELVLLARGVPTWDAEKQEQFDLHAYVVQKHGDMKAVEKASNMKGTNGESPCRTCEIKGQRNITDDATIYLVPLAMPNHGVLGPAWDPLKLPIRTEQSFIDALAKINAARNQGLADVLAKHHGINGLPVLRRVGCMLDRGRTFPWDFMHLLFENTIPNLVRLWSGEFKGLDTGTGNYEIDKSDWEEIWAETDAAMRWIPSAFTRTLVGGRQKFTAEAYCFWFLYLMPGLLKGRFADPKYHTHACELARLIKKCLQFSITDAELDQLERDWARWVQLFEEYYYQYEEARLGICPLTIHGLLHIVYDIRNCGPSWVHWTFWMERYCGWLKHGLRSKVRPWANLNKRILHFACIDQFRARYNVEDVFAPFEKRKGLSKLEHQYPGYDRMVVIRPYQKNYTPAPSTTLLIASYLANTLGVESQQVLPLLPSIMPRWARIRDVDGDTMRSALMPSSDVETKRDTSFVRFEMEVLRTVGRREQFVREICYGQLEEILVCRLPQNDVLRTDSEQDRLFAVISPCYGLQNEDATEGIVAFSRLRKTKVVVDVNGLVAVAGRYQTRGRWIIVDRSGPSMRPEFIPCTPADEPGRLGVD